MKKQMKQNFDEEDKQKARVWFEKLRDDICAAFEKIEADYDRETGDRKQKGGSPLISGGTGGESMKFAATAWKHAEGGGGLMSVMRGRVFEKVGVNVSTVSGFFSDEFKNQIPGASEIPNFWAAGISLVAHMRSPKVPAVHMNTRMIVTTKGWFGGGCDLTPMKINEEDRSKFHADLKECCGRHPHIDYQAYRDWCDRYFFLPHRNEHRGIGGLFFDALNSGKEPDDWQKDFEFVRDVGETFKKTYCALVYRHMFEDWTEAEREHQLVKRGRYVEFNLLHDRGTLFGLRTGGNIEAILMSLPPEVKWP